MFKLLDLYCGAGGAGQGYHLSGFSVVGVDIAPQKRYPFEFIQGDAIEYLKAHGHEYDAVHASPPCQEFSVLKHLSSGKYPDLIWDTRIALIHNRKPYIIENVVGAPLINPVMLCGSMFELRTDSNANLRRHRNFESTFKIIIPCECQHVFPTITVSGNSMDGACLTPHPSRQRKYSNRQTYNVGDARTAMGIDWMTGKELSQAIPPAYTKWIGDRLMAYLCSPTR